MKRSRIWIASLVVGREEGLAMPWHDVSELPPSVRHHLPLHAQEIFLAAFNRAWADHAGDPDAEAVAFRIAWGAVKRSYRKKGDVWTPRDR